MTMPTYMGDKVVVHIHRYRDPKRRYFSMWLCHVRPLPAQLRCPLLCILHLMRQTSQRARAQYNAVIPIHHVPFQLKLQRAKAHAPSNERFKIPCEPRFHASPSGLEWTLNKQTLSSLLHKSKIIFKNTHFFRRRPATNEQPSFCNPCTPSLFVHCNLLDPELPKHVHSPVLDHTCRRVLGQ
jgi:hypothetical protein